MYKLLILAVVGCLLGSLVGADETDRSVRFAKPVRIMAGIAHVGDGRMYPSPAMHDLDGDGKLDLIVADLIGKVTIANGAEKGFAVQKAMLDRDGKPLKFHNW